MKLRSALGMSSDAIIASRTKEAAVETLIAHLEEKQVLVSRSVQGYMPQRVRGRISGLTVKDPKVPYIFLARETKVTRKSRSGVSCSPCRCFSPCSQMASSPPSPSTRRRSGSSLASEYDITGEFLMPEAFLVEQNAQTASDVRSLLIISRSRQVRSRFD